MGELQICQTCSVKAFGELTRNGQARRLAALARPVLTAEFGLASARIRLVATHSFNTVFRIDAGSRRYALRVGARERIHPRGVEDVEAAWLDDLAGNGLLAPQNVATIRGHRWVTARHAHVPGDRVCTLFTWVDGVELRDRLTIDAVHAAGRLLARLHQLAATASIENVATELRADRAIYFADRDLVATHPHRHQSLFAEATARVQHTLDALWHASEEPHLLHGDFGPHNILTRRGHLRPIDFQDLRFGYRVQDLGLTLADLQRRNPSLRSTFTRGYAEVEPLPAMTPDLLAVFAAARSLNIMNLALYAPDTGIARAFDGHAERVRKWMVTTS